MKLPQYAIFGSPNAQGNLSYRMKLSVRTKRGNRYAKTCQAFQSSQ